jgi:hypothetical protein
MPKCDSPIIIIKVLHFPNLYVKMELPNKLNIHERGSSLSGRRIPFFAALNFLEFGKNANSAKLGVAKGFFLVRFQLVWRQLEFAFFCALTPVGAPFYFSPKNKTYFKEKRK